MYSGVVILKSEVIIMKISRTIKTTTITARVYNPTDDTLGTVTVEILGGHKSVTDRATHKAIVEAVAPLTLLSSKIESTAENIYECTLEDFLKVAKPVIKDYNK